ncbi:hypothetical protein SADUNF_Sadunf17G0065800 [Salix dunnii]|uniref:NOT2/NOT3/NOT5 C-terminal domain-containing protein n=1 Tax=Salix dunnii TaxID=1413687 RepID=A0A835MEU9_9ROSI|nr:hypothetical protein SADUNF_Sadunf17G0065800 [Salix dunnii]
MPDPFGLLGLLSIFGSPWSEEPAKGDLEFNVPKCYYAKSPPPLDHHYFSKFSTESLLYAFYSYERGWLYKEQRRWFKRVPSIEPLVKTSTYERGSYHCFEPNTFEIKLKLHVYWRNRFLIPGGKTDADAGKFCSPL